MPIKMRLPIKQLDRYILQEIISTFIGSCIFIIFILFMFQCLRLAEFLIVHGAPAYSLGKLSFYMMITFFPYALPMSFLLSILISFARFSSDSELVAMKASGISLYRISLPVFVFAIAIVIISFLLHLNWVPWSERGLRFEQKKIGNSQAISLIKQGTFTTGFFNLLIFADKVDQQNNQLYQVFIYDAREPKNPLTYVAREADMIHVTKKGSESPALMLRLYKGSMHHQRLDDHFYEKIDFDSYSLFLTMNELKTTIDTNRTMLYMNELNQKIAETDTTTLVGREFRTEYWRRCCAALSPFIFAFLGIGLGSYRTRSAKSGATLVGIIILVIYWIAQTMSMQHSNQGNLPAWFAMQIPNLLLLPFALVSYRRANW